MPSILGKKVKIALTSRGFKVPLLCCGCGAKKPPYKQVPVKLTEGGGMAGKIWTWTFKFPYCESCAKPVRKMLLSKGIQHTVLVVKSGWHRLGKMRFLEHEDKLHSVTFLFLNKTYGELFEQANKEILFDKVFEELGKITQVKEKAEEEMIKEKRKKQIEKIKNLFKT